MSSTILELIRLKHETSEVFQQLVGDVLDNKTSGQKSKVKQQHYVKNMIDVITATNADLQALYADGDGLLKEELSAMRGNQMFKSFYESLNSIREYHVKFPNLEISSIPTISDEEIERNMQFSGEEVFGKYFDLHELFVQYCNLPNMTSLDNDYLQYLDKFNSFFYIPESNKGKPYKAYLDDLWNYLRTFFLKIQPLVNMDEMIKQWKLDFSEKWAAGKIPGWTLKEAIRRGEPQPLRLGMFNSSQELEALGMDRLKEALEALGLKCGGTLKDRAERLWSVRGKKAEEIPEKLKAKAANGNKRKLDELEPEPSNGSNGNSSDDKRREIAWVEYQIITLCDLLSDIVSATRKHVAKQQTRTLEEKELELYEEEFGTAQDLAEAAKNADDGDDEPIYNPLNLPLGWDGKPIPYWLYKLHGLGVEFKCEICGNQSYWGRRNFDRHFQEWKHAYGMRCLGIPNTKHFHDITLIEDAIALHAKLRGQIKVEQFTAELEEEFEDSQGNVLNRRTYEDLARQGLL